MAQSKDRVAANKPEIIKESNTITKDSITIVMPDERLREIMLQYDYEIVDNGDGTIFVPDLSIVDTIFVDSQYPNIVYDPTGLTEFPYLKLLVLSECNYIRDLDFSDHQFLEKIELRGSHVNKLTITNSQAFKELVFIFMSDLDSLILSNCDSIASVDLNPDGKFGDINITDCDNLTSIGSGMDAVLSALSVSNCMKLERIDLFHVTDVSIINCPSLTDLSLACTYSLILEDCLNIKNIRFFNTYFPTYTIADMPKLEELLVEGMATSEGNKIEILNVTNCPLLSHLIVRECTYITKLNVTNCPSIIDLNVTFNQILTELDLTNFTSLQSLNSISTPLPIIYIPEPFTAIVSKDSYTQLAVLRDTIVNPVVEASQTGAYKLDTTGAIVNIVKGSETNGSLLASTSSNPSVVSSLPSGVNSIRDEKYWIIKEVNLLNYEYNLILDLSSIDSLDVNKCVILFRQDDASPWIRVADTAGSVKTVAHFKIINELTSFGEFAVSDNTEPVFVKKEEMIPKKYGLEQNYPNPFNPSTLISYSVKEAGFVTLTVYNSLGQKVADLVKDYKQTGNYKVTFDANELSSGIYFYKIQANGFVETKKMILMK